MSDMFRALFETAPDAMLVVDRSGTIALANPQAERLFAFAPGTLAGCAIEVLVPERVRTAHVAHRDRYMAAPRVRPMGAGQELVGRRADGSEFPVEIALSPISTDRGPFFVASIRDISETQRARQALARAQHDAVLARISQRALAAPDSEPLVEELPSDVAAALQAAFAAIVLVDAQGRAHVRASSDPGSARAEAFARAVEADRDFALAAGASAPRLLGTPFDPHAEALRSAGWASGLSVPLADAQRPIGALFVLSSQPRVFDRDSVHFLQSVANVLASALLRARAMDQLAHAQRLEAVGQLTGGIAHDFNNLLTVVSGNLQILESELADRPEALELIGNALRAVGNGAELTRKLLAFARRQRLAPTAIAPQAMLVELAAMLKRTIGDAITLETACEPGTGAAFADPSQLDAALLNLTLNARDAMPRGGRLRIEAREATLEPGGPQRHGRYVVFAVRDTGVGMAPEVLARAFEPFFTTKSAGKGSGLGLSMVYGFVTQSGGHIAVDSQLGYGTTIELFLPAADTDAVPRPVEPAAAVQRGSGTVLVVEDEPDVRQVAVGFVRSLGYEPIAAADAASALEAFERNPHVDAVFSDVALGIGADGRELARALRERRPGLPILLTSGFERSAEAGDGADLPLLPKPYRREELADALRRVLDPES